MVEIDVKTFLAAYYTNEDGDVLHDEIVDCFDRGDSVIISFRGIPYLNSSFVNSAFIQLLEKYPFDYIKTHLTFKDSTKQINSLILSRFKFETQERKVLV